VSIVICLNNKCEHIRDEVCPLDETNCRIKMWDEISNCPEAVVESQPAESKNCRNGTDTQQPQYEMPSGCMECGKYELCDGGTVRLSPKCLALHAVR